MKMTIKQIRDIIGAARWLRNDLVGGTAEEFRKQNVGPQLADAITRLKALQIPARFVDDEARRNEEIVYCRTVITRWELRRAEHVAGPISSRVQ